jgi:hypothetical protein
VNNREAHPDPEGTEGDEEEWKSNHDNDDVMM